MNQKKIHIFLMILIITMATAFVNIDNISAKSKGEVEKEIIELQKEQKGITNKKDEIDSEKKSIESEMDENLSEQESVQSELDEISGKLTSTEANIKMKEIEINELKKEVTQLEADIKELDEEIIELKERIQVRSDLLKDRLRSIQENGGLVQYVSVILGSETFADLITRSSTVNVIMDQDKSIMEALAADQLALQEKQLEVKTKKTEVEDKKKDQEKQKARLQSMKVTLDEQKDKQAQIKSKLAKAYEELEDYSYTLEDEAEIIAAEAAALEQAKKIAQNNLSEIERKEADERRKAESNSSSNTSSSSGTSGGSSGSTPSVGGKGYFIFPTSGYISSPFRPAHRPTHNGIDIAAPQGTAVNAGASGVAYYTVTGCSVGNFSCGGGYGNHVRVLHHIGNKSYVTVYAHLSSVGVSNGQAVSQGQYLGGVGNTGHSYGNHLHFEVHPGGYKNPANPKEFLP